MIQHPDDITPLMGKKSIENIFFKKHLRQFKSVDVDARIHQLYQSVSAQIDCTECGNCCKKLEPGLESKEIERLAQQKNLAAETFKELFVAFDGEAQFLKTKPCMFLADCKCTIYEHRPAACAGYPHLDGTDMKYKSSMWSNYALCPIVFNVLEALKKELHFSYGN